MKNQVIIGAVCALSLAAVAIAADDPHEKAIKGRQGLMQVYSFNMGIMSAMAKGKTEYDAELAANAAANLHAAAIMKNGAMWPADSSNDKAENTRALPEMWSTYPKVLDNSKALADSSAALMAVAGNGLDALKDAIGDVGRSCKGCHDDFREKKK